MTAAQMIVGLGVLGNHGPVTITSEHDQVWAWIEGVDFDGREVEEDGDGETHLLDHSPLSEVDVKRLFEQGWFYDSHVGGWSHFT